MSGQTAIKKTRERSIGDISRRSGVKIETIRYYEKIGILDRPGRTAGGRRTFDDGALKRLAFVRRCRELGFSLDEIRALLALAAKDYVVCDEVRGLTEDHLHNIRSKVSDLRRMETALSQLVEACRAGTVSNCPIIDTLYSDPVGSGDIQPAEG